MPKIVIRDNISHFYLIADKEINGLSSKVIETY